MKFTMQRDRFVASTLGHAIEFKKGVPTYVPPELHQEVMNLGAEPEDELPVDVPVSTGIPSDPIERTAAINAAFTAIVLRNVREEFTAGGAPHSKAIALELGWPLDARERDTAWEAFQQAAS